MKLHILLAPLLFLTSCKESPEISGDVPGDLREVVPEEESVDVPLPNVKKRDSFQRRCDEALLAGGYAVEEMRAFIEKNREGLSVEEMESFRSRVLEMAKERNFVGCLKIVREDFESYDGQLNAGGSLFQWAGYESDQDLDVYFTMIDEESTNADIFRYYSRQLIRGIMSSNRERIDELVAHTLNLEDAEKLNYFANEIGLSFYRGQEKIADSPVENSDILITLLEERGADLDKFNLRQVIQWAHLAGAISVQDDAIEKYSNGSE
ncbi:MAG: hypothetical protein ABF391_07715 [Akkermansiaceae bacterium]